MDELMLMIDKFNATRVEELTFKEQMQIYNFLKELEIYRKVGTLEELMKLKEIKEEKLLNPIGEYACKFAENHGITMSEAMVHPTVKAFAECFNSGLINSAT